MTPFHVDLIDVHHNDDWFEIISALIDNRSICMRYEHKELPDTFLDLNLVLYLNLVHKYSTFKRANKTN